MEEFSGIVLFVKDPDGIPNLIVLTIPKQKEESSETNSVNDF